MLAWDCETELIGEHLKAPPLVCVSWACNGQSGLLRYDDATIATFFGTQSTGLNVAYDVGVVVAQKPELMPAIFEAYASDRITDISVRQKLIDIAQGDLRRPQKGKPHPYSLAALSERLLGKPMSKGDDTWRLRYGELREVPLDQWPVDARSYAITDAERTLELYTAQEPYAELLVDQYRQARAAWWLHLMHCWGFRTDQRRLEAFAKEIGDEYETLEKLLISEGLIRVKKIGGKNPRTEYTRDVGAVRARLIGAGATKATAGGQVATDADSCKASGDPVLRSYARLSSLGSLRSGFIEAFRGKLQIHPNFDELVTNGRTSSYDPNVQNLARMLGPRECVVARPGYVLADNDYPQIELRTWAQICLWVLNYSRMAELLNATPSVDPHLDLAARILGIPYADAKRRLKEEKTWPKGTPKPVSEARQISKVGNFGYMGGMGWKTFIGYAREQYDIILSDAEAKKLHYGWKDNWPEAKPYFEWVESHPWYVKQTASGKPIKVTTVKHWVTGRLRGGAT